jgi:hypothetical protein
MATARFKFGNPLMVKHTPGSAVAAGDVIELVAATGLVGIAHTNIPANVTGNLSVGPGVYEVVGDAAIDAGDKVWWNGAGKVTETSTTNPAIGWLVSACTGDNAKCSLFFSQGTGGVDVS